jgi:hypothetical protein
MAKIKNQSIKVKREITRCVLINTEKKKRWLKIIEKAQPLALASIYQLFREKNKLADKYVLAAFKHEPKLLDQLKMKVKKIKKTALSLEEESERPDELRNIEEEINSL